MTLFFLLNPKMMDAGALVDKSFADPYKKYEQKEEVEKEEKEQRESKEIKQELHNYTYSKELEDKVAKYYELKDQIKKLDDKIKSLVLENNLKEALNHQEQQVLRSKIELARLILLMQEEEQVLLTMLIED